LIFELSINKNFKSFLPLVNLIKVKVPMKKISIERSNRSASPINGRLQVFVVVDHPAETRADHAVDELKVVHRQVTPLTGERVHHTRPLTVQLERWRFVPRVDQGIGTKIFPCYLTFNQVNRLVDFFKN
jgi:hypothetical protein